MAEVFNTGFASFVLAVGTRNFGAVSDEAGPVLLNDGGELILHVHYRNKGGPSAVLGVGFVSAKRASARWVR